VTICFQPEAARVDDTAESSGLRVDSTPVNMDVDKGKSPEVRYSLASEGFDEHVIQINIFSEPDQNLELNCLLLDQGLGHVPFKVEIANTKSVSALKEVIKEKKKNAFQHFDADDLIVWQASILVRDRNSLKLKLKELNLLNENQLWDLQELKELFSEPPIKYHIHILVKLPTAREFERFALPSV
jgi:hypothetical protein